MKFSTTFIALFISFSAANASDIWGGRHVELIVENKTAIFQFDCGEGRVSEKWIINSRGTISADGTTTTFTGGPVRPDMPKPEPVITKFTAKIMNDRMILTMKAKKTTTKFELLKGSRGELFRCM